MLGYRNLNQIKVRKEKVSILLFTRCHGRSTFKEIKTVLRYYHHLKMRQNSGAHQDCDLLHDLDAGVPGLPAFAGLTDRLEERQQRRNAQCRGHHREGSSSGVTHVLVRVVNIGPHRSDLEDISIK